MRIYVCIISGLKKECDDSVFVNKSIMTDSCREYTLDELCCVGVADGVGGNAGASGKGFGEELGLVVASLAETLWVERNGDDEVDGAFFEQELEFGPHEFAEFVGEFWGIAVFEEVDECAGGGGHA